MQEIENYNCGDNWRCRPFALHPGPRRQWLGSRCGARRIWCRRYFRERTHAADGSCRATPTGTGLCRSTTTSCLLRCATAARLLRGGSLWWTSLSAPLASANDGSCMGKRSSIGLLFRGGGTTELSMRSLTFGEFASTSTGYGFLAALRISAGGLTS